MPLAVAEVDVRVVVDEALRLQAAAHLEAEHAQDEGPVHVDAGSAVREEQQSGVASRPERQRDVQLVTAEMALLVIGQSCKTWNKKSE